MKKIRIEEQKTQRKLEADKLKESEMWNRSNEFNSKFKKVNKSKKESKRHLQPFYRYKMQ